MDDGVRIPLSDIYAELREVRRTASANDQSLRETILPRLDSIDKRITAVELRLISLAGGVIAAFGAGKGLGIL
jgi:hypothetical protein